MKRLLAAFVFVLVAAIAVQAKMVSIAGDPVNMRSGPSTRHPVLWELGRGFPLIELDRRGGWIHVKDFEGDTGWVAKRLTNNKSTVIVTKSHVNICKKPSTKSRIVATADYGLVLKLLGRGKGWVKVQHPNMVTGWIKRTLVWGW